jgi:predicted SAM-dependent methyltransferase
LRKRQPPQELRGLLEGSGWHSSYCQTDPTGDLTNLAIAIPESGEVLLNLGCGNTYDARWINLDLVSHSSDVIAFDILQTLPFPDSSIDVVYASHLLEHLAPHEVPRFMRELFRILKPYGILRIVVPDLEQIVSEYMRALTAAKQGSIHERLKHQWMIVELLDQLVRQSADGGEMMRFLFRNGAEGVEIATTRLGSEISENPVPWDVMKTKGEWVLEVADQDLFSDESLFERRSNTSLFDLAIYRKSGDAHLWMYDEVSLADVLTSYGFSDPVVQSAFTSRIPEFACYNLDVTAEGSQRKPDSLYMEAIKPEQSNH